MVSTLDVWALGITIVIGGQYFCWNAGFAAGLSSYVAAIALIGSGYLTMVCSVAEVTSALPFAGGAYGLARCSLGFSVGFLVGMCEILEYIAYVASSVLSLTQLVLILAPSLVDVQPLLWLLIYGVSICIQGIGGPLFWRTTLLLAVVSFSILLLWALGSASYVAYPATLPHHNGDGSLKTFMTNLPLAAWLYVGVEAVSLASDEVENAKAVVPKAQLYCILTLLATSVVSVVLCVGLPPGVDQLPTVLATMSSGFILFTGLSDQVVTAFAIPATFATVFGFIFAYGKLIAALASSQLLPHVCAHQFGPHKTPLVALLLGSCVGYLLCLLVFFCPGVGHNLFNICMLSASTGYASQCVGYVVLRRKFKHIQRSQPSVFGIPGAMYALAVWALVIVAIAGFQNDSGTALMSFLSLLCLLSVYYHGYAKTRQTFSEDERKVLFVAHIAKCTLLVPLKAKQYPHRAPAGGTDGRGLKLGSKGSALLRSMKSAMSMQSKRESAYARQVHVHPAS
ncbi:hypothetical protein SPRG_06676 [Saprolegnia parasitica CBS 223.65]|uniref:Amino acid permease/ SLC12A domain-containing protein n=1 Tax=Saprolegnia parasitica (strain CBS 223.65) TaxID=695850 RepID=A0A067CD55_SAPPC|nr:hypothetical protein SPRG_06676 [Saprolegnia parasitica CBS 223.65]KDO28438.1 hypothetical protein SPRG_06676 [Saprolegnia parasitica CBS 223.65]|eukprot:XP_012200878.1 hypothetical protein SPRG_06676 [Saprolegnia parasitica CBS 223.65]